MASFHDTRGVDTRGDFGFPISTPPTPSPTPPRSPSTRFRTGFQHGNAEQGTRDNFGRPATFRTNEPPRTPRRARSPGTAKIETEKGTTGVNVENNRLNNPSAVVSDWQHSSNLYVNTFKKSRRIVHSWLISNQKWTAS